MKTIKYKNVIFINGFMASLGKLAEQPIDSKDGWNLAKLIKELNEKGKIFDEQRTKLIEKYAEKKDGQWVVKKGNEKIFEEKFQELVDIEEEYKIEAIKLGEDVRLSTKDLIMLEDLLEK